jgi:uncharacterized protein (TIRG00374 family)
MRRAVQIAAGIAVSALALWLTLRGKDLGAAWAAARAADYRFLLPYSAILLVVHLVKTARWALLLRPVARVPFARVNAVAAVGFMALVLLPFRLGELARPLLIADRSRLRTSAALSSVVVERAADGAFMGVLLVVALLAVPEGAPAVSLLRAGALVVSGAFAALLAFLVFAYRSRARAVALAARLLAPLPRRAAERGAAVTDAFLHGLRVLPGAGSMAAFLALTAAYWLLNAAGLAVLARGFALDLAPVQACAVLGVLVVGVMIPAGPGMVGTYQGAIVLGLSLVAPAEVVATRGVAYANVVWAAQLTQTTLMGLLFLPSRHVRLGRLLGAVDEIGAKLEEEEAEYRASGDAAR